MKNIHTTQYKITDNRGYEEYLSTGAIVEVIERIRVEQDELLKTRIIMKDGNPLWIRGDMCTKVYKILTPSQPTENIVEIPYPSDNSHGIDLYRVQYISPLINGCYELTMGWMERVKLTQEIYPRAKIMQQWKAVRNK